MLIIVNVCIMNLEVVGIEKPTFKKRYTVAQILSFSMETCLLASKQSIKYYSKIVHFKSLCTYSQVPTYNMKSTFTFLSLSSSYSKLAVARLNIFMHMNVDCTVQAYRQAFKIFLHVCSFGRLMTSLTIFKLYHVVQDRQANITVNSDVFFAHASKAKLRPASLS